MIRTTFPFVLQNLIWPPTRLALKFFADFEVTGLENIEKLEGPVIFAGNHTSELDPILLPASLPFLSHLSPVYYVAKKREFYEKKGLVSFIYGGEFFRLWGAYPVREGLKNYGLALNMHIAILNLGKSLLIFPEGGIPANKKIGPAHGGIAFLSKESGAPIVPIAVRGVREMSVKDFFVRRKKITLIFGKPIYPAELFAGKMELAPEEYKIAAQKIMDEIGKMLRN